MCVCLCERVAKKKKKKEKGKKKKKKAQHVHSFKLAIKSSKRTFGFTLDNSAETQVRR